MHAHQIGPLTLPFPSHAAAVPSNEATGDQRASRGGPGGLQEPEGGESAADTTARLSRTPLDPMNPLAHVTEVVQAARSWQDRVEALGGAQDGSGGGFDGLLASGSAGEVRIWLCPMLYG